MTMVEKVAHSTAYQFTNDWFGTTADLSMWRALLQRKPQGRYLEVGSYEGRSATFAVSQLRDGASVTCVDTWAGSADLSAEAMSGVESRFDANMAAAVEGRSIAFRKIKQPSHVALATLIAAGETFDLIYIDGSHTAPDVLSDAVQAFHLMAPDGVVIFDDYLWSMEPLNRRDILNAPGFAIDMFGAIYARQVRVIGLGGQKAFQRIA